MGLELPYDMEESTTSYVATPESVSDNLQVGWVVFGREGRSDSGIDIIDEDGMVIAELDADEANGLASSINEADY